MARFETEQRDGYMRIERWPAGFSSAAENAFASANRALSPAMRDLANALQRSPLLVLGAAAATGYLIGVLAHRQIASAARDGI